MGIRPKKGRNMKNLRKSAGDSGWFTESRFGLFIHWGLYALPARNEWVMHNEGIPPEEYEKKYFRHFDPDLYDPGHWARAAKNAGMKYFAVTTKHHDGFCLWDSKLTGYKAPASPAGRDLLKPLLEAFRKEGFRTGLYHSLLDWHHPDYVSDPAKHDMPKYVEYLHGQVRELLTEFGVIDLLFLDFSSRKPDGTGKTREDWQSEKLYDMIRKLQPGIMLNDRLDLEEGWDIKTPEQVQPREWVAINGQPVVWEACQTFCNSWGYHRDESPWRDTDEIVRTLADCVSKGGNLLLNVGPTGRGELDERTLKRLEGIGRWMKNHGRAIYGCTKAPEEFKNPADCRLTYNPVKKRLYVHLFAWPYRHLCLDGTAYSERIEYVQLLHDASEVKTELTGNGPGSPFNGTKEEKGVRLTLPLKKPDTILPVLEIFLK